MDRSHRGGLAIPGVLAAVLVVVSAPVVAWHLVGPMDTVDRDQVTADRSTYDHMVSPPSIDATVETAIGWVAVVAAVLATVVVVAAVRHGGIDRRWSAPIAALTAAGALVGIGGRVVTAAVIGANIGGGMVVLFGLPLLAVLCGFAAWRSMAIVRSSPV